MPENVLITGASGLIGSRLTEMLLQKGYGVSHLSRSGSNQKIRTFQWNVDRQTIDPDALRNQHAIIHLAGAGIAEKRWTEKRKKELLESRTHSTRLLFESLSRGNHAVKTFISASGVGYYGPGDSSTVFKEGDPPSPDFIGQLVRQWEEAADKIATLGIRVVKLRTGVVLSPKGGALREIMRPVKLGLGAPLGTGKQLMSWIHIDDLCRLYCYALEKGSLQGTYNAVSVKPVSNKELTATLAETLKKPLWLPNVPSFLLRIVFGEMADIVLTGSHVSSAKLRNDGFEFTFVNLEDALRNLLNEPGT